MWDTPQLYYFSEPGPASLCLSRPGLGTRLLVSCPLANTHTPSRAGERGGQAVDTKSSGFAVFLGGFPIPSLG